jgi:regulator of replication initiation timing
VTKLKMNITTKEDLKAENGRLNRELEVARKGIEDLKEQFEGFIEIEAYKRLQNQCNEAVTKNSHLSRNLQKQFEDYQKEHSLVIQLDGEVENLREQLRQAREENVKYGKENEHLWGLLKIKMEG